MRRRLSPWLAVPGLLLVPIVSSVAQIWTCGPTGPGGTWQCTDPATPAPPPVVCNLPEHWGSLESLGFFTIALIAFWVLMRLRVLRQIE
jgi:hypothetical protein